MVKWSHKDSSISYSDCESEIVSWWQVFEDIEKIKSYHKYAIGFIKNSWWVEGQYTFFYSKSHHGYSHSFQKQKSPFSEHKSFNCCITPEGMILMTNYGDDGVQSIYNPLNNKVYLKSFGLLKIKTMAKLIMI